MIFGNDLCSWLLAARHSQSFTFHEPSPEAKAKDRSEVLIDSSHVTDRWQTDGPIPARGLANRPQRPRGLTPRRAAKLEKNHEEISGKGAVKSIKATVKNSDTCFFCTTVSTGGGLGGTRSMSVQDVDNGGSVWIRCGNDSCPFGCPFFSCADAVGSTESRRACPQSDPHSPTFVGGIYGGKTGPSGPKPAPMLAIRRTPSPPGSRPGLRLGSIKPSYVPWPTWSRASTASAPAGGPRRPASAN